MKAINLDKVTTPVEGSGSDEDSRPIVGRSWSKNNYWLKEGSRPRVGRSRHESTGLNKAVGLSTAVCLRITVGLMKTVDLNKA
jgi:hypothetical protein